MDTKNMDATKPDPVAGWTAPGGETGLEEPMWQLGLNSGPESYPERPDVSDCIYYLRTGFCGFGDRCRFNHPPDNSGIGAMKGTGGEYPERMGQPICQYYARTGMCKFGASCKYHHPRAAAPVNMNIYGYPLRPGEKECTYYVRTGQCKYGLTCKFHHPQPAGFQVPAAAPGPGALVAPVPAIYPTLQSPSVQTSQQGGVMSGNWSVGRPTLLPGSYIPGAYGPMLLPPGMVTVPGWTPYPAPVGLASANNAQPTYGANSVYGITQLSLSASAYAGQYLLGPSISSQKDHPYPERHGQPECMYYMKTGDCKYGSSCKYHHPLEWNGQRTNSDSLPFHPGVQVCFHFAQNGVCKYGSSCKFDHPMGSLSHSPSASSLTDMPVAPYPVGSSAGTLAPTSSSSDLRPELVSDAQQHGQSSTPVSSSTGDAGQGGEAYPSS